MRMSSAELLLTLAPFLCFSCTTSTQTSVTAPDGTKCQATLNGTTASFSATGGTGAVTVSTTRDCQWTASSGAVWISINGSAGGQGDGSVSYTVAANVVPAARSGALVVASTTVQLNQAAAPCLFTLSRAQDRVPATGGVSTVDVSTLSGCAWTAAAINPWISIVGGQNGNASGTVTLSIAANAGGARTGQALVAGQRYTVTQTGARVPSPSDPPPPATVHLEGSVALLLGRCPNLQFLVSGTPVVADDSTDYRKEGSCGDMRSGANVTVDGVSNGAVVRAQTIQIQRNGEDEQ
jgi:hypothetical protein